MNAPDARGLVFAPFASETSAIAEPATKRADMPLKQKRTYCKAAKYDNNLVRTVLLFLLLFTVPSPGPRREPSGPV